MRTLGACVLLVACVSASCNPQAAPPPGDDGGPAGGGGDIVVNAEPLPLFSTGKDAFAVVASANRTAGSVGTVFNVTAEVRGNSAAIRSFAWRVGAGDLFSADQSASLTLSTPGSHLVNVTVTDENGQSSSDGIDLTVFDSAEVPANVTSQITPSSGMPGTVVRIQASQLNSPAADVKVMFGGSDPVEVYRPKLGVANAMVPLNAADGLGAATAITVTLLIDGQAAETLPFTLSPLPPLTAAPGELTRRWLQNGSGILAGAQGDLAAALAGLETGLTREEIAFLQALLHYASVQFDLVSDALLPLFNELDNTTLAMLDHGLIANGVATDTIDKLIAQAKALRTARNAKDAVLDQLCAFHELMDSVLGFIDAVSKGALAIPVLQVALAATPVYPALVAIGNIAVDLGIVGDLLHELVKHVPRVGDSLTVRATPGILKTESEKAVVRVEATLIQEADICAGPADLLADLVKHATERIVLNVPVARLAYLAKRRAFFLSDPVFPAPVSSRDQFDHYLTETLNTIAEASIQATGLTVVFGSLRGNLCSLEDRKTIALQPDPDVLIKVPSGAGNFLNLQAESIDFFCTLNDKGPVTLRATRQCGTAHVLTGETKVTCFGEECTEDASASLDIQITPFQVLNRNSPCGIVKPTLETRIASIQLTNTHATRTIRVSGVLVTQSDKRSIPRGPCSSPPPPQTVQDCLESTVGGCDSFAGFLQPGETSLTVQYNCKREDLFPGSGLCGEMELETETSFWIWQAVFCDDDQTARQNFCPLVHEQMLRNGLPSPVWPHLERHDCP